LSAAKSRTLEGRRIVITRAAEQAGELREGLENLGAEVLLLPMIRFLEPKDNVDIDRAIRSLPDFSWLVFTSANAVSFFVARCRALGISAENGRTKIAAVGSATSAALAKEGLAASLVPREFSGMALAKEFGDAIAGKSVLLPRSDRAGEELPAALRRAGAQLTEVIAYRTAGPDGCDQEILEAIRDGRVDAVTFFSPSAVREFHKLIGANLLRSSGVGLAFAAVGPVTAAAIRAAGLPVAMEADEAKTASVVAALERYFAARGPGNGRSRMQASRSEA
jgi:uroporphyrinogen-III synthase